MLRRFAYVVVVAVTAVGLLAAPASANERHSAGGTYLALGDSLAYGYQPTGVTGQGYADQLYASLHAKNRGLRLTNLGCPGETSTSMLRGGVCPYPHQRSQLDAALNFLRAHRGEVNLITLDIGANDVDGCVSGGGLDQNCVIQGLVHIAVNTSQIVARLRAAAPHTTVVAMTYYDPFLASWLTGPAGQALAVQSLQTSALVNGILAGIYQSAGFRIADVAGAFATTDMSTMVGGIPLAVARICQWTWMCAPAPVGPDIHANQAGYAVIAQAFAAVL